MGYHIVHTWPKTDNYEQYNSVVSDTNYESLQEAIVALERIADNVRKTNRGSSPYWYRDNTGFMYINLSRTATGDAVNWTTWSLKWVNNE